MKFNETKEFEKDFKKLGRKYRSLKDDLKALKEVLEVRPTGSGGKHFHILHKEDDFFIIKTRLYCQYLGKSTLRVIYALHEKDKLITFIEIYFKGTSELEDKERIKAYIKSHT